MQVYGWGCTLFTQKPAVANPCGTFQGGKLEDLLKHGCDHTQRDPNSPLSVTLLMSRFHTSATRRHKSFIRTRGKGTLYIKAAFEALGLNHGLRLRTYKPWSRQVEGNVLSGLLCWAYLFPGPDLLSAFSRRTKDSDPGVPRGSPIPHESRCKDMAEKLIYWWV